MYTTDHDRRLLPPETSDDGEATAAPIEQDPCAEGHEFHFDTGRCVWCDAQAEQRRAA